MTPFKSIGCYRSQDRVLKLNDVASKASRAFDACVERCEHQRRSHLSFHPMSDPLNMLTASKHKYPAHRQGVDVFCCPSREDRPASQPADATSLPMPATKTHLLRVWWLPRFLDLQMCRCWPRCASDSHV